MEINPTKARGHVICEENFQFTEDLWKLYHICIGFNQDPLKEDDFKFTYEYEENFTTFPTICVKERISCNLFVFLYKELKFGEDDMRKGMIPSL